MLLSVFSFKYKKTSLAHITAVWTSPNLCYAFTSNDFVFQTGPVLLHSWGVNHNFGPWMNKTQMQHMISLVPCSFFDFFKIIRIWKKHPQPSVEVPPNKKIPNDVQFSWNPTKVMDLAGLLFVEFLGWLFQGWGPGMGWGWDGMDSQALAGWCGWFKAGVPMGFLFSWSLRPTWFQGVIGLGVIFDWWLKGGNHPPFMHFGSILLTQ